VRALVIIPTFNERDNLAETVVRVLRAVPSAALLVVDDGSPDGTGEIADQLAREHEQVHVLHRSQKRGLGAAYLAGFRWALDRDFDIIVEMDADGSHSAGELPRLLDAARGADLVIGTRWMPGGSVLNWPAYRRAISRIGTGYARILLHSRLRDITSGYRAFRADALRALDLDAITSEGYCFQIEMAWQLERARATVTEVPISFVERSRGRSKMTTAIVAEALWKVTCWGIADRMRGRRRPRE